MLSEQDPNFTRQKVNWVDLEEDSEEEKPHQQKETTQTNKNPEKKKAVSAPKEKTTVKSSSGASKEKHVAANIYACDDLDYEETAEKETAENDKKKENALSDLLKVSKKPEEKSKPQAISKKEQKQKELEELEKILGEFGLNSANQEQVKPVSEGEGLAKKKKKKKEKEEKKENEQNKSQSPEKKKEEQVSQEAQIDKEQALQAALKKHAEKKKHGANAGGLEIAKHEILARKEKAKKTTKNKKVYEDQ